MCSCILRSENMSYFHRQYLDVGRHQGTSEFNVFVMFCLLRCHHLFSFFLAYNKTENSFLQSG